MQIIPAIDILNGKVVRLKRGSFDAVTVYSDDPVATAKRWENEGARIIHVVDLSAARTGEPSALKRVVEIASAVSIPVQLGGGMRNEDVIVTALSSGISRVVLGTKACQDEAFLKKMADRFKERILVSIDVKNGLAATEGWEASSNLKPVDLAKKMENIGIKTIIYTDISRDGTMAGPNLEGLRQILSAVKIPVIASGGVSSLDDILKLKELEPDGLCGVIFGRALYEGKFSLKEAVNCAG